MDLLAPGENATMPYYFPVGNSLHGTNYVNFGTGTSFSSPPMVGAAALIKQIDPAFTPAQIMQIMSDSGTPVYDPGDQRHLPRTATSTPPSPSPIRGPTT